MFVRRAYSATTARVSIALGTVRLLTMSIVTTCFALAMALSVASASPSSHSKIRFLDAWRVLPHRIVRLEIVDDGRVGFQRIRQEGHRGKDS